MSTEIVNEFYKIKNRRNFLIKELVKTIDEELASTGTWIEVAEFDLGKIDEYDQKLLDIWNEQAKIRSGG